MRKNLPSTLLLVLALVPFAGCAEPVVDFSGECSLQSDTPAQDTFVTHPWVIRDATSDELLADVPAPTSGGKITVHHP